MPDLDNFAKDEWRLKWPANPRNEARNLEIYREIRKFKALMITLLEDDKEFRKEVAELLKQQK